MINGRSLEFQRKDFDLENFGFSAEGAFSRKCLTRMLGFSNYVILVLIYTYGERERDLHVDVSPVDMSLYIDRKSNFKYALIFPYPMAQVFLSG
jgi:hypothetical protein